MIARNKVGPSVGARRGILLGLALVAGVGLVSLAGCGDADEGCLEVAKENLIRDIGDALKAGTPPPPDTAVGEALRDEAIQSAVSGVWDVPDADPLVDRVNPDPGPKAPAPGDS